MSVLCCAWQKNQKAIPWRCHMSAWVPEVASRVHRSRCRTKVMQPPQLPIRRAAIQDWQYCSHRSHRVRYHRRYHRTPRCYQVSDITRQVGFFSLYLIPISTIAGRQQIQEKLLLDLIKLTELTVFFLLSHHILRICKKRKYFNRPDEKKVLSFAKCSLFHIVRTLNEQSSIYLSVCLSAYLCVCLCVPSVDTITFEGVTGFKKKFGGCLLCIECSSGIKIQSKILIPILTKESSLKLHFMSIFNI